MSLVAPTSAWPLVGRAGELRLLQGVLAKQGARGVIVGGPDGVGKTRLIHESLRAAPDLAVVQVAATRASSELPFAALAPLLPEGVSPRGSDGLDAADLLRGLTRSLGERTGDRRPVLVVDDAHLLDSASAVLVHQLVAEGTTLLLASIRSGARAPDPMLTLWKDGLVDRLDLEGLDGQSLGQLLTEVLGGPVDPATVVRLAAGSRGNALYLRELVLGGLASGGLATEDGVWRLAGTLEPSRRLVELVESRLAGLDEAERELLEVVAVGEPLRLAELAAVTDVELAESLERHELLASDTEGGELRFRLAHPLHGEVLRQQMSALRKQRVAGALARAVEGLTDTRPDDQLRIATWRLHAGDAAPDLLLTAAVAAQERRELVLAASLARAAVQQGAGFPAAMLTAELAGAAGDGEAAEAQFAVLVEEAADEQQRTLATLGRIDNLRLLGRFEEALALTEGVEHEVAARRAGLVLDTQGPDAALPLAEAVCSESGPSRAWACIVAAQAQIRRGRTSAAIDFADRARSARAVTASGALWPPELPTLTGASALAAAGQLVEAEEIVRREHDGALLAGAVDAQAFAAWYLADIYLAIGRVEAASRHAREAAALFRSLSRLPVLRECLVVLARAEAARGQLDRASAALAHCDRLALAPSYWTGVDLVLAQAWTATAAGDLPTAKAVLQHAGTLAEQIGDHTGLTVALHDQARLGSAQETADRLAEVAATLDGDLAPTRAEHAAALARRDPEHLRAVSSRFESLGALLLAAEAAADAAVAWTMDGQPRHAAGDQRRAADLAERCEGATTPALGSVKSRSRLTPAERKVATLAAAGRSNREIAAVLVLSLRTVENRLHRIYEKLGISGRAELKTALEA